MPPTGLNSIEPASVAGINQTAAADESFLNQAGVYQPEFPGPMGRASTRRHFIGCNGPQSQANHLPELAQKQLSLCL